MRVLIGTDGSPAADVGVDLVAGIDWPAGTAVRVVRAVPPALTLAGPWPSVPADRFETLDETLWKAAAASLQQTSARLARPGLDVSEEALRGRAASAIVAAASNWHPDLVVVGSRGHGAIQSMVLGSVSAEVIDRAPAPVLVARQRTIKSVVFAWDGSACAQLAAGLLREWPIFGPSLIRVVSVADIGFPWWAGLPAPEAPETIPMYLEAADANREEHEQLANEMADSLRAAGRYAVADRREGDPAGEILAAAEASKADLIVLGTRGRTGIPRLVLGSVARNVLHHASCSVLVVRESSAPH